MKSYCKNFEVTEDLVWRGYSEWSCSESGHKNSWRVFAEYGSIDALVHEIYTEIKSRRLTLRIMRFHTEREPNGKVRVIGQESVKQQVCDYICIVALSKMFNDKIGYYQIASIKGKGPLFGARKVQKWLKDSKYYIHADIKKCYQSIQLAPLLNYIYKRTKCNEELFYLLLTLFDTYERCDSDNRRMVGLAIGSALSLKLSQLVISNFYHLIEEQYYLRRGKRVRSYTHQIWYADDLYLFGNSKKELRRVISIVSIFMKQAYGVEFKPWKIARCDSEPVDIAGYVVRKDRITIRDKTYLRIRRAYARFSKCPSIHNARTVCSYWGQLKHTSSRKAIEKNNYYCIFSNAKEIVRAHERRKRMATYEPVTRSSTPIKPVSIFIDEQQGITHVWMHKNIHEETNTVDGYDDKGNLKQIVEKCYVAEELYFPIRRTLSVSDINNNFDAYWNKYYPTPSNQTLEERLSSLETTVSNLTAVAMNI